MFLSPTSDLFILDFLKKIRDPGMYLKLILFMFTKLIRNYILFKTKTKSHKNIWETIAIPKRKPIRAVVMFE